VSRNKSCLTYIQYLFHYTAKPFHTPN